MHEIGHALGLDHPFEGNIIPAGYDDVRYTIMSYTAPKGVFFFNGADPQGRFIVETPGVYDIAAVQDIYGANMTFHSGRDSYIFTPDNPVYQTIWDAGGIDTFDVADFTKGCSITLVPGTYSLLGYDTTTLDANIGIAFNCTIENVSGGSGDDRIVGNDVANVLIGGEGNDTISGGGGNDVIEGCAGTDTENGGSGNDTFSAGTDPGNDALNGSEGTDVASYARAKAGVTVDLAAGTASGTDAGDMASIGTDSLVSIESVIGGAFADKLIGNANNNTLTGGRGDDQLLGGSGRDTASYANASGGMKASLALTAPQDTISDGKDTLSSIENLTGSVYNDVLTGNTAANILDGGKGADILIGGLGNDSYRIDNSGDNIVEDLGAGHDIVIASLTFTLSANVEDLTLIGAGAVNGTGNALVNVLRGNAASNVLSGGRAADQLFGGGGSDTLVGGADRDLMTGGTGADTFRFVDGDFGGLTNRTCDTIIDFNHSEGDRIDLSGVDANTKNGNANDAFTFIGSDPFNQIAGQLRATLVSGVTVLQGDTNGDGAADFWIRCDHAPTLAVGDLEL
jgi:serralysin